MGEGSVGASRRWVRSAMAIDEATGRTGEEGSAAPAVGLREGWGGWRDLWQAPLLGAGALLLASGAWLWVRSAPGPDFDGALDSVERALAREEYDRALGVLNGPIRGVLDDPELTREQLGQFYALRADAVFLAQRDRGVSLPENYRTVIANYDAAVSEGASLGPERTYRLASSALALDRVSRALELAGSIGGGWDHLRHELMKDVIDRGLSPDASPGARRRAATLLAQLRQEPMLSEDNRRWAVLRQTRISLDAGFPEEAIRRLLPEVQRLESPLSEEAAELYVLLGRAYFELGRLAEARRHLERAVDLVGKVSVLASRAEVLLGRIAQNEGDIEDARDRFAQVASSFPQSGVGTAAWLGLGETESDLGNTDASLRAYERAVLAVATGRSRGERGFGVSREEAAASLGQRHTERFERQDYEGSLRFAELALRLWPGEDPPADAVLRVAMTHRSVAEALLEGSPRLPGGAVDIFETDPATLEQARRHFERGGEMYVTHARLTLLGDPEESAESLWRAADAMDRAGDPRRASELFREYVEVRHDDPRRLEGMRRLAETHESIGDYAGAVSLYERVLSEAPSSETAYRSYVPLARCYLLREAMGGPVAGPAGGTDAAEEMGAEGVTIAASVDGADGSAGAGAAEGAGGPGSGRAERGGDVDRAEALLLRVVGGELFTPTSPEFRAALLELGELYMGSGRYTRAIERLTEAEQRYEDLAGDARFVFRLAEANRLEATAIGGELERAMPQSERQRLRGIREERLGAALELYERARQLLQDKRADRLTDLELVMLRNALFYRGDCAFDLGEHLSHKPERSREMYEQAIRYYDAAAQRHADDPSSLVAMIQIVNCYAALGRWREVETAHERARARLEELPEGAWEGAQTPMDRRHWERWLEASIALEE